LRRHGVVMSLTRCAAPPFRIYGRGRGSGPGRRGGWLNSSLCVRTLRSCRFVGMCLRASKRSRRTGSTQWFSRLPGCAGSASTMRSARFCRSTSSRRVLAREPSASRFAPTTNGSSVPVGAYAETLPGGRLRLFGQVTALDGARQIAADTVGPAAEPERVGSALADELIGRGAQDILDAIRGVAEVR
jgi:porphobilinogen deaminase-like protein